MDMLEDAVTAAAEVAGGTDDRARVVAYDGQIAEFTEARARKFAAGQEAEDAWRADVASGGFGIEFHRTAKELAADVKALDDAVELLRQWRGEALQRIEAEEDRAAQASRLERLGRARRAYQGAPAAFLRMVDEVAEQARSGGVVDGNRLYRGRQRLEQLARAAQVETGEVGEQLRRRSRAHGWCWTASAVDVASCVRAIDELARDPVTPDPVVELHRIVDERAQSARDAQARQSGLEAQARAQQPEGLRVPPRVLHPDLVGW